MVFYHSAIRRHRHVYILLASLLWFHLFLMLAAREKPDTEILHSGGVTVIQAMERTVSDLLLPVKVYGERLRSRLLVFAFLTDTAKTARAHTKFDSLSEKKQLTLCSWELLFAKETIPPTRFDTVLRI